MAVPTASRVQREPVPVRLGLAISDWTERWFPDAFIFALVGIVVVFALGLGLGRSPGQMTMYFGSGFWALIPFTMQMALIVIFGYVVAASPPVYRLVQWLATIPKGPRAAVAWIALFSTVSSLLSWGFSLVFSGLLVREVVRRVPQTDYRAAGAAGYLGLGSVWALDLNTFNFIFLLSGLLLHWRRRRFLEAVTRSVPATAGVLIQFPFYAGIFGMITGTASDPSPISQWLAGLFVRVSDTNSYPILVSLYSAVLGVFVPSGGSKWVMEAPYLLQAANALKVNLGWVVQMDNAAEGLPNLINPFWMLPLLGLLGVRARALVGYAAVQLLVHLPVVLFLMWLFARTLPYIAPAVPP